jgi:hypothetical protein
VTGAGDDDPQQRLERALARFVEAYRAQPDLVAEQRGWNPVIGLSASDVPARVMVAVDEGRIAPVWDETVAPTLEVSGVLETLCDVLSLRKDPNEPYLFGELTVAGAEADFVRLDYIASRLCPR